MISLSFTVINSRDYINTYNNICTKHMFHTEYTQCNNFGVFTFQYCFEIFSVQIPTSSAAVQVTYSKQGWMSSGTHSHCFLNEQWHTQSLLLEWAVAHTVTVSWMSSGTHSHCFLNEQWHTQSLLLEWAVAHTVTVTWFMKWHSITICFNYFTNC